MRHLFFTFISVFFVFQNQAQIVIGDTALEIHLQENPTGVELQHIFYSGTDVLEMHSYLFYLYITDLNTQLETRISATSGWGNIAINNNGTTCTIDFSQPQNASLPPNLAVHFSLQAMAGKSQWDLAVSGLGNNNTLTRVNFPKFKLKTPGNDAFFIPKFSGKEEPNPLTGNINYDLTYPRGRLGASMPFSAYYNNDYGIYLAFHDANATLKNLVIAAENNYVKYYGKHNIPDKTLPDNNWELPGVFELDLYEGNWYEASMIYKEWAQNNAMYYPQDTPERLLRQENIGKIDIWGHAQPPLTYPVSQTETDIQDFINLFPSTVKVGIHWYKWNNQYMDDNYPDYFPERQGFVSAVQNIQQQGHVVMPYINGMLYDTDLPAYPTDGFPYATKDSDGNVYSHDFGDSEQGASINTFAFMCPSQTPWQDTLISIAGEISNRLQAKSLYVDMVGWAGATECMDTSHGHPLATGSWWFDGYQTMFTGMYQNMPGEVFITTEGATDNLTNVVDGFLVGEWREQNLVPAFQTIYGGKNQFFGVTYGGLTYNDASFYAKFSSFFVNNIQPGRMYLWFAHDQNAATARPYIIDLAVMRHKLRNFMSFGTLLKPFTVNGVIPDITSDWGGTAGNVTVSALQKNVYKNKTGDSIAFVFSNASMTDALDFDFDFDGNTYGFTGDVTFQKISPAGSFPVETHANSYTQNVHIDALETIAYLITDRSNNGIQNTDNQILTIYPNPVKLVLHILIKEDISQIQIYNMYGQALKSIKGNNKNVYVGDLKKGFYFIKIQTGQNDYITKIIIN